jgi:hypothetical protein
MPTYQAKPPLGSQVNRAHPLARDLVAGFLFQEGSGKTTRNVVPRRLAPSNLYATMQYYSDFIGQPFGVGISVASAVNGRCTFPWIGGSLSQFGYELNGAAATSVSVLVKPTAIAAGNYKNVLFFSPATSGGLAGLWLNFDGDNGGRVLYGGRSSSAASYQEAVGGSGNAAGNWVWLTMVSSYAVASSTIHGYRNGLLDASATAAWDTSTYTPNSGSQTDCLGSNPVPADSIAAHVAALYLHRRALSAAEVAELHAEPWGMFAPSRAKLWWFGQEAAAPTFRPWIHRLREVG